MFGRRITLFRLFGFEVRLDASWIVVAALVTWSLAAAVFPSQYPTLSRAAYWWMGLVGALGLFGSVVLHELCHALVARQYRLPMKGITLFIFGGVAEMGGEPQSPKVEFLMALAGPVASILLGLVFQAIAAGGTSAPPQVLGVISYLGWINWILAAFNLIPAFPLDGGRVLRAAVWHWTGNLTRATEVASKIGTAFAFLLMLFAALQLFSGNMISAIWYFLIGMFLRGASQMSYRQVLVKSALEGVTVRRFMRHAVAVDPELTVRQLVDEYMYRYDLKVYPVVGDAEDLIGCVTTDDVKQIPREEWDQHRVSEIAKPCSAALTVSPDSDALQALAKISEGGAGGLLVVERNHLLGIVSPRDVMNFMSAKMELEGHPTQFPPPRHA
jgi:Zn-dependent protease/CBS domain-containing protein